MPLATGACPPEHASIVQPLVTPCSVPAPPLGWCAHQITKNPAALLAMCWYWGCDGVGSKVSQSPTPTPLRLSESCAPLSPSDLAPLFWELHSVVTLIRGCPQHAQGSGSQETLHFSQRRQPAGLHFSQRRQPAWLLGWGSAACRSHACDVVPGGTLRCCRTWWCCRTRTACFSSADTCNSSSWSPWARSSTWTGSR